MKKIVFGFVVLCVLVLSFGTALRAQETYNISDYLPLDAGNTWEYSAKKAVSGQQGMEQVSIMKSSILGPEMFNAEEVLVMEENDRGPWLYLASKPEGIVLYKIRYQDYYDVIEQPQFMFYPKNLEKGQDFVSSTPIKRYDLNNNLIEEGKLELTVRLEEAGDLTVPAGTFTNCIKLYRLISTKTDKSSLELKEEQWFAPNVGRVSGEHSITITGNNSINFQENFELTSAVIKGQNIPGKPAEQSVAPMEQPKAEEPAKIEEPAKANETGATKETPQSEGAVNN